MDNKSIQKNLLEVLKAVDGICRRENLSYMLTQGTLLGAVREKGFIEWDIEDVDIMMHHRDFNFFEEYCSRHASDSGLFIYYTEEFVPRVVFPQKPEHFAEIILIDPLPHNKRKRKIKRMKLGVLRTGFFQPDYGITSKAFVFTSLFCGRLLQKKSKLDQYKKVCQPENEKDSGLVFFSNENIQRMSMEFEANLFQQTVRIPFEDTEFSVPKEWDALLKFYYGADYMVPKRDSYYA